MDTKTCFKCKRDLPVADFGKNARKSDGYEYMCIICKRAYNKANYEANREIAIVRSSIRNKKAKIAMYQRVWDYLLANPCVQCGEADPTVLEFDHIDQLTKEYSISAMLTRKMGWDRIEKEINKCRVLCANCHRRHTAKQLGWYKGVKK